MAVGRWASVGARRRVGGRLRSGRPPPAAAERILARGLPRTGPIPRSPRSAPGARRLRTVRTIGARRNPAPVRQPVVATGHRPAVRRPPVHRARRSRGPRSSARRYPARGSARSRRPGFRQAARSGPAAAACANGPAGAAFPRGVAAAGRTRRRRPARSGPRRRPADRGGGHPGVFAWAGHRHRGPGRCRHVPPGTSWAGYPAAPQDMPYLTSVGREKSPVGARRSIVINCT